MEIRPYTPGDANAWNEFVARSKNGTFLFNRNYMDYHADRFKDCSLMVYDSKGRLSALFPANRNGDTVHSHQGLTYGGLVMDNRTSGAGDNSPLNILEMIAERLRKDGVKALYYKPVPHIYHRQPAEEDLYALWRMGAHLDIRNLSTTINLADPIKPSKAYNWAITKCHRNKILVKESNDASLLWPIITRNLKARHNASPVHSTNEIQLLHDRFPSNIKLFIASIDNEIIGGFVIFICGKTLHLQYAGSNDRGKQFFAEYAILNHILTTETQGVKYFDFGISNENRGLYLNPGLLLHKEIFGGRSIVYDTYRLDL